MALIKIPQSIKDWYLRFRQKNNRGRVEIGICWKKHRKKSWYCGPRVGLINHKWKMLRSPVWWKICMSQGGWVFTKMVWWIGMEHAVQSVIRLLTSTLKPLTVKLINAGKTEIFPFTACGIHWHKPSIKNKVGCQAHPYDTGPPTGITQNNKGKKVNMGSMILNGCMISSMRENWHCTISQVWNS